MPDTTSSTAIRPPVDYPLVQEDSKVTVNWRNFYNQLWLFLNFNFVGNIPVPPSYTTAQRDAIADLRNGMIIYNTDLQKLQTVENGSWVTFTTS